MKYLKKLKSVFFIIFFIAYDYINNYNKYKLFYQDIKLCNRIQA